MAQLCKGDARFLLSLTRSDSEARGEVVVDHAAALHEGVADGRAAEVEAALAEVFAHGVGLAFFAGTWDICFRRLRTGEPSTNRQT
jgi:hypothetical protein